ncbi:MAG: membrane protein insertase YidC [Bacteroidaceae bacterium]|nr:membrane protein insertase YidC [Bacteroidaceae bacterium]
MDKNTVTGLILIVAVLIGWSYLFNQPQQPADGQQAPQEQAAKPAEAQQSQKPAAQALAAADTSGLFAAAIATKGKDVTLENKRLRVTVSTLGGAVSRVELKDYKSYADFSAGKQKALVLYDNKDARSEFVYEFKQQNLNTSQYAFSLVARTDTSLTLALSDSAGRRIVHTYTLPADGYLMRLDIQADGLQNDFSAKAGSIRFNWADRVRQQEKGFYFENMYSTLTYKSVEDGTEKLNEQGDDDEQVTGAVDWIAFKNQYFSSLVIAAEPMHDVRVASKQEEEGSGYLKHYAAEASLALDPAGKRPTSLQYYFGPNKYLDLKDLNGQTIGGKDQDLQELVYLGWPLFKWINRFFTVYVFDWLTRLNLHMGLVLLIITLLIRAIVYPTTRKSYLSSAKMRVLKPKIDELNKQYPGQENAMKRQQEMMTLYSQYGVSPMGGCLPMLIQMPIWIAMFNFVPNAIELRQQSFLWADDLSTYDSLLSWSSDLPLIGNHLSLFCLLFCATNLIYSYMTMRQQRDTMSGEQAQQMKMMQWMMFLMPVFFFFMFNKYSAGLNYYYFISLLAGALSMWWLRRTTDDKKLLERLEANYRANKANPAKRPSGLAARFAALQEQQEELRRKQERFKKK